MGIIFFATSLQQIQAMSFRGVIGGTLLIAAFILIASLFAKQKTLRFYIFMCIATVIAFVTATLVASALFVTNNIDTVEAFL